MQSDMEDAFRSALMTGRPVHTRAQTGSAPTWRPPIEVYETSEALVVEAEIAGLADDAIEVSIDDSVVSVRGERVPKCDTERRSTHEMSISYGPFAADIFLPFAVDTDRATATYDRGLLRIELPRRGGTKIPVGTDRRDATEAGR
jgi:HSP20 family molecular chaperone IbpA